MNPHPAYWLRFTPVRKPPLHTKVSKWCDLAPQVNRLCKDRMDSLLVERAYAYELNQHYPGVDQAVSQALLLFPDNANMVYSRKQLMPPTVTLLHFLPSPPLPLLANQGIHAFPSRAHAAPSKITEFPKTAVHLNLHLGLHPAPDCDLFPNVRCAG